MKKDIFEWQDWDVLSELTVQFYNCIFLKDFGPYLKNESVALIAINYYEGLMKVYRDINEGTEPVILNITLAIK